MAASPSIDPKTGYSPSTKTYHSLRPPAPLPPPTLPLSITAYALSLLPSPLPSHPSLIDASTSQSLSFPSLLSQVHSLSSSLHSLLRLSSPQLAFVLSPPSLHLPVLYLSLLSLGVVVSPSNPALSPSEIAHQFALSKPSVAFATSSTAPKLPPNLPNVTVVLLDSPEFQSLLSRPESSTVPPPPPVVVRQSDPAVILYSSGTTGRVKGVLLTHRNFIALIAGHHASRLEQEVSAAAPPVALFTIPLFHVFGFFMLLRSVALGDTTVLMERFDFVGMLKAIQDYRVTFMPVSPPLVVAMVKSGEVGKYDLSSLQVVGSGGAPLGSDVAERFAARFPGVEIAQGYGLTESTGGAAATAGPEEIRVYGSVGRLAANLEAKIVDPATGEALPPGKQGELWLRGPIIMQGYVGDDRATTSTLTSEGWLKTGDLCYFNDDGFLFIVDRLKELIKYKAYQVPPAELEHVLQSHPEIADAAVIPYPDEEAGQIPMAFVVRQPGSTLSEKGVMDFVAKEVAPYKKIRRVSFINTIPKSAAGKILRRELVTLALSAPTSKL